MIFKGNAHKYGSDIDTDAIIPARYLNTTDHEILASHCMEDIDKEFVNNVKHGDIIVAGENFGCGSSREHAAIAIKAAGVSCVIAKSYARIFYRNAINVGLPVFESRNAVDEISNGDTVTVDTEKGTIEKGIESFEFEPFPPFVSGIIEAGGLMNMVKKEVNNA
jgi:3-isopropylmalate/(R)-2-methylmalate dehydratase small subunit